MTAQQILNALPLIQNIMDLNLPIKKAYEVYTLAKLINEKREFFINEEKKIIEKFNATVAENGTIRFQSPQDQLAFYQAHSELMNYEVDDLKAVELSLSNLESAQLKPYEIGLLENIITFVD